MRQARSAFDAVSAAIARRPSLGETLRSFSWMMVERLTALVSAILVTIPVARHLGPSDFGAFSYVLAVSGLVGPLATMGLNHIVTRELVEFPDRTGAILGTAGALRKLGALIATLGVIAWVLFDPPADTRLPLFCVAIVAANFLASMSFLQFWFLSNGKTNVYSMGQVACSLTFAGLRLFQVLIGASLEAFLWLAVLEVVAQGFAAWLVYSRARETRHVWRFDRPLARKLFGRSWPLILSSISAGIYLKLAVLMLGEMSGHAVAGTYAVAARISEIWYFVPQLLMNAVFPHLTRTRMRAPEAYRRRLQDGYDLLAAAGMAVALMVSIASPFLVPTLFGPEYAAAAPILSLHVWAGVFVFMRQQLSRWMILEDLYIFSLVTHGVGAAINIAMNLYMIPRYGAIGAAWAALLSYASASYLSLLCHRRTWPQFAMMTKALFWPRRIPEVARMTLRLRRL